MEERESRGTSAGGLLEKSRMYVLKRGGTKERGIHSFDDPIVYITPAHVIGEMNLKVACVQTVPLGRRRNR